LAPWDEESVPQSPEPSEHMIALGIVQAGEPGLAERARIFTLPQEAADARRAVAQLASSRRIRSLPPAGGFGWMVTEF
jgi:hypothetical protein